MEAIDLLYINGNILSFDDENQTYQSIAVSGDLIVGTWKEADPRHNKLRLNNNCQVVNLKGKTMIPGFIDTHNHILTYAKSLNNINCGTPPNASIKDVLELVRVRAQETPTGEWVEGYGYDDTLLEEARHLNKDELDQVAPNHPVFIKHISGHLAVANTLALKLAGIKEDIENKKRGWFGRNKNGSLNGVLYEKDATKLVELIIPAPSEEQTISMMERAAKEYVGQGITTNTDSAVGIRQGKQELDVHLKAAKNNKNPMRTQLMIMHHLLRSDGVFADYTADQLNQLIREKSGNLASLDSAKMFQDGSLQGLTGAVRKPYHNMPDVYGELFHNQGEFNEEIKNLHDRGFRLAVHGNGDRAIGSIIEAYEYALTNLPKENHLHRIEHVQTATDEDLDKMEQLGIAGSIFINHIYYWGDRHKNIFLGEERAKRMNGLASIVDRNILFTLHSDCPITPISPLFSIWCAVNRLTRDGEVLGSDQRIDVNTAFRAMTIYGAKLINKSDSLGSIEIGKKADFAVLSDNPIEIDQLEIKDIKVLATIIGGETVYEV